MGTVPLIRHVLGYAARHPLRAAHALATDPAAVLDTMVDRFVQNREYRAGACRYEISRGWEADLHRALGAAWPCGEAEQFHSLWHGIIEKLQRVGLRVGPESFNGFNDGDAALARAIWCIVRHRKPERVVETGVAHGVTSRVVLDALMRNEVGALWSIDRPPLDRAMRRQIGIAVEDRSCWSLIEGSSRRRLPGLLVRLQKIDLFVHDSFHTARNVLFEIECAWRYLSPGGAMVIDDLDTNWAFRSFLQSHAVAHAFVCESDPVRPDHRRFNGKGLFGIILKSSCDGLG